MVDENVESKNKQSSSSLVNTAVKNFCETSTIHGISSIFKAKNIFMRVFWIAMFVSVWSLLVWQVLTLIKKVYSNDIIITTRKVYREKMDFPTVSIANADPYSKERLGNFSDLLTNVSKDDVYLKKILSSINKNQLLNVGHQPTYFSMQPLQMCMFGGDMCWDQMECLTFPLVGNILVFNLEHKVKQRKPGSAHGFSMILNINASDYSNIFRNGYGVLIYISNEYLVTYRKLRNGAISVAPGTVTQINIRKKEIKRLPHPFPDNCKKEMVVPGINGLHFKDKMDYSRGLCEFTALLQHQIHSCSFADPSYKAVVESVIDIKKSNISFKIPEYLNASKAWDCLKRAELDHIENKCQPLCNDEEYDVTVSSLRWPTTEEAVELLDKIKKSFPASSNAQNWTVDDVYKNLLKIEIYFSDFEVEVVQQKPAYGWSEFVSDFGGQVGLWIGASVYSAFEIGSLLLSLCYCLLHKLRCGKKSTIGGET